MKEQEKKKRRDGSIERKKNPEIILIKTRQDERNKAKNFNS